MSLKTISALEAKRLLDQGAVLVDVREADEFARERIPGALLKPLSKIAGPLEVPPAASMVIFHCRSGNRTRAHAGRLVTDGACEGYVLEGGLDAWKAAGLPTALDRKQPIELMRQVQIGAGGLVLAGVLLGATISPWFYALSAFVGGGLLVAGVTGFCGMARVLKRMPWNRAAAA